ncbi:Rdx family protein [Simulacricoccus sp. 17bor-14]|nr:Rdx family protein [Simulacricoccus sp. 17bor-14]
MKDALDVDAELKTGPSGSFEVSVDGRTVVRKAGLAFPTEQEVVDAVARALGP